MEEWVKMNEAEEKNGGWNGRGKMKRRESESKKIVRKVMGGKWRLRITSANIKGDCGKLLESKKNHC